MGRRDELRELYIPVSSAVKEHAAVDLTVQIMREEKPLQLRHKKAFESAAVFLLLERLYNQFLSADKMNILPFLPTVPSLTINILLTDIKVFFHHIG